VLPGPAGRRERRHRRRGGTETRYDGRLREVRGRDRRVACGRPTDRAQCDRTRGPRPCRSSDLPLQKKGASFEFLREIAHLRCRGNTFGAVFRVRNQAAWAIHKFFQERGFHYVHTPIITASDCEGAGAMFAVSTLLEARDQGSGSRHREQQLGNSAIGQFGGTGTRDQGSGNRERQLDSSAIGQLGGQGRGFRDQGSGSSNWATRQSGSSGGQRRGFRDQGSGIRGTPDPKPQTPNPTAGFALKSTDPADDFFGKPA